MGLTPLARNLQAFHALRSPLASVSDLTEVYEHPLIRVRELQILQFMEVVLTIWRSWAKQAVSLAECELLLHCRTENSIYPSPCLITLSIRADNVAALAFTNQHYDINSFGTKAFRVLWSEQFPSMQRALCLWKMPTICYSKQPGYKPGRHIALQVPVVKHIWSSKGTPRWYGKLGVRGRIMNLSC